MQFLPDQLEMPQVQNAAFDQNQVLGADAALQTSLASGSPLAKLEIEMATENLQLLIQHANNRVSEVAGQNFERSLAANQLIEENFANFSTFQSQVLRRDSPLAPDSVPRVEEVYFEYAKLLKRSRLIKDLERRACRSLLTPVTGLVDDIDSLPRNAASALHLLEGFEQRFGEVNGFYLDVRRHGSVAELPSVSTTLNELFRGFTRFRSIYLEFLLLKDSPWRHRVYCLEDDFIKLLVALNRWQSLVASPDFLSTPSRAQAPVTLSCPKTVSRERERIGTSSFFLEPPEEDGYFPRSERVGLAGLGATSRYMPDSVRFVENVPRRETWRLLSQDHWGPLKTFLMFLQFSLTLRAVVTLLTTGQNIATSLFSTDAKKAPLSGEMERSASKKN